MKMTPANAIIPAAGSPLAAADHPVTVYLSGLGSSSRRTMLTALRNIAAIDGKDWDTLEWWKLSPAATNLIRSRLAEQYAPSTANRHLAALHGVLKECWRLGYMDVEAYNRASDFKNVVGERLPAGRDIQPHEVRALLLDCLKRNKPCNARDAAIIAMLYTCGLRRAELVSINVQDINIDEITVIGKRNKQRKIYVRNKTLTLLNNWLAVRGDAPGALFQPVDKYGHIVPRQMTTQALFLMLQRRAAVCGIEDISPHDFRRTFIGELLDAGTDLVVISKMVGHSNVSTTAKYDRRGERAKQDAAARIDLPL